MVGNYRLFSLAIIFSLITGCFSNYTILKEDRIKTNNSTISIWLHDTDQETVKAFKYAASVLEVDVFEHSARCPAITVENSNEVLRKGINVYDDPNVFDSLYSCDQPYAAISKGGHYGVINLCEKRINPARWSHMLIAHHYTALNLVSKVLGLPPTTSRGSRASYTSNDRRLMTEIKLMRAQSTQEEENLESEQINYSLQGTQRRPVYFDFYESEKKALRLKYCK